MKTITTSIAALLLLTGCDNAQTSAPQRPLPKVGIVTLMSQPVSVVSELTGRTAAAMSDQLIDEIAIIGTREQCQQRLIEYAEGGVHTHIVSCLGFEPALVDATYQAFAPEHFRLG